MIADCGHDCTPAPPTGGATGYATLADGSRICYACSDDRERAAMATADRFVAYIGSETDRRGLGPIGGHEVTTWPGGYLGRVISSSEEHVGWTPTGGRYTFHHVTVRAPGGIWYGRTEGVGTMVRLKRSTVAI